MRKNVKTSLLLSSTLVAGVTAFSLLTSQVGNAEDMRPAEKYNLSVVYSGGELKSSLPKKIDTSQIGDGIVSSGSIKKLDSDSFQESYIFVDGGGRLCMVLYIPSSSNKDDWVSGSSCVDSKGFNTGGIGVRVSNLKASYESYVIPDGKTVVAENYLSSSAVKYQLVGNVLKIDPATSAQDRLKISDGFHVNLIPEGEKK
ncbi:hypothetical protein [Psychromicrobium lacuslunae]|uniref:Uncharacterized protein n=1 Tax=Psychromicrobium lacuslunae TaxID=1618207 RepID=A0A0D4BYR4_9MICC|nr:hypothetical protein [Psychromicrobium lacuslunae]AJT41562.1 hypothetical protein UM93_08650 [Psychromicrobium lacuslunae]